MKKKKITALCVPCEMIQRFNRIDKYTKRHKVWFMGNDWTRGSIA